MAKPGQPRQPKTQESKKRNAKIWRRNRNQELYKMCEKFHPNKCKERNHARGSTHQGGKETARTKRGTITTSLCPTESRWDGAKNNETLWQEHIGIENHANRYQSPSSSNKNNEETQEAHDKGRSKKKPQRQETEKQQTGQQAPEGEGKREKKWPGARGEREIMTSEITKWGDT